MSLAAPLQESQKEHSSVQEIYKIFICRVQKCRLSVPREALETRDEDEEGLPRETKWRFSVSREALENREKTERVSLEKENGDFLYVESP